VGRYLAGAVSQHALLHRLTCQCFRNICPAKKVADGRPGSQLAKLRGATYSTLPNRAVCRELGSSEGGCGEKIFVEGTEERV
jgi:hypothetical protein